MLYSIPIIVVLLVVGIYYSTLPPTKPVMDFNLSLTIIVQGRLLNGSLVQQFIVPPAIGSGGPGSLWNSHVYDSYGLDQRYPIYTLPPGSSGTYAGYTLVYVRSAVARNYTLGNFFAVWGEPLGQNNTLGLTSPPPPPGSPSYNSKFGSDWYWDLCIGSPPNVVHVPPADWAKVTLTRFMVINLVYSGSGCLA